MTNLKLEASQIGKDTSWIENELWAIIKFQWIFLYNTWNFVSRGR